MVTVISKRPGQFCGLVCCVPEFCLLCSSHLSGGGGGVYPSTPCRMVESKLCEQLV